MSAPNCRMDPSGWAVARWLWCTDDDAIDGHPIFPESAMGKESDGRELTQRSRD